MSVPRARAIYYRSGYEYQLHAPYAVEVPIYPGALIATNYIRLATDGLLRISVGYAWDGPSGLALDTRNFMRGSLVHDALYQLMRARLLNPTAHRPIADRLLRQHCREDGMSWLRAWWVYCAVRMFGGPSALPRAERPVLRAPRLLPRE